MSEARSGVSLVGRQVEVAVVADAVRAVRRGLGGSVWVDGEPGIGKSAVVAAGLDRAVSAGCVVFRGAGQLVNQSQPLYALLACHREQGVGQPSGPATLGESAGIGGTDSLTAADTVAATAYQLVSWIESQCVRSAFVLFVDDLHWADEESLLVWGRLSEVARQSPLLQIGATRSVPGRVELARLRHEIVSTGGALVNLTPLAQDEVTALVTELTGAPPGPRLRMMTGRAGGNPLYLRELIDAAARSGAIEISDGVVELSGPEDRVPMSLVAAIEHRLGFLSTAASAALRAGAVLGEEFSVGDLAIVTGSSMATLVPTVMEAVGSGVLADAGDRLAFRHGLIRQALYEGVPLAQRAVLHRRAARALAEHGVPAVRVAGQLLAAVRVDVHEGADDWTVGWLVDSGMELAWRAPELAVDLLARVVQTPLADVRIRQRLNAARLEALELLRDYDAIVESAPAALAEATDPEPVGKIGWHLGRALHRVGRSAEVAGMLLPLLHRPDLPVGATARLRALHAIVLGATDPEVDTEAALREAEADAARVGDRFALTYALYGLALAHRTDNAGYERCLEFIERGLAAAGDLLEAAGLRHWLLICKAIALYVLDRPLEADAAFRNAVLVAEREATPQFVAWVRLELATWLHLRGRWDDMLAELSVPEIQLISEPYRRLLIRGLRADVALHRDDRGELAAQLGQLTVSDRFDLDVSEAFDLGVAWALSAERDGRPLVALRRLGEILDAGVLPAARGNDNEVFQLPDGIRLAVPAGDLSAAERWVELARLNAVARPTPLPQAVYQHCAGLLAGDPAAVLEAAVVCEERGGLMFAAQARENAAVLYAQRGDLRTARRVYEDASTTYVRLEAMWDLRRGDARLRRFGIRRTTRAVRRPSHGWAALSPVELQVAGLVATGMSNPDIARELFLSAYTVRSHVSNILAKLDARSRIEIARGYERQQQSDSGK